MRESTEQMTQVTVGESPLAHPLCPERQRLRGSMSLFFALSSLAILMVMGLLVDGGGALNAANRSTSLAQEAARTAGQQTLIVTVLDTYDTHFAQLVGVGTIDVTGTANARLQTQAGG